MKWQMKWQGWVGRSLPGWSIFLVLMGSSTIAIAAERVVLQYGILQGSIPVSDLTTLAETGEAPRTLRAYLRRARQNPDHVRDILTREIAVNPRLLNRLLVSPVGNVVLDQVGMAIHTPSRQSSREAARSTLLLSTADDGRFSLLELIQNYPTQEVYVDGDRLLTTYNQIQTLQERIGGSWQDLQERLGDLLQP